MTDFTDYQEAAIIDWAFGDTAFPTRPGTVYVALHAGTPGDDASQNEVSTADGYSRQGLANPGDWNQPASNQAENATQITFGPATADWGNVSHLSLWDSQTGGNSLYVGDLDATREVLTNDEVRFDSGDIDVTVD